MRLAKAGLLRRCEGRVLPALISLPGLRGAGLRQTDVEEGIILRSLRALALGSVISHRAKLKCYFCHRFEAVCIILIRGSPTLLFGFSQATSHDVCSRMRQDLQRHGWMGVLLVKNVEYLFRQPSRVRLHLFQR